MTKGLTMARAVLAQIEKIQADIRDGVLPPVPDGCTPEQYADLIDMLRPPEIYGHSVTVSVRKLQ